MLLHIPTVSYVNQSITSLDRINLATNLQLSFHDFSKTTCDGRMMLDFSRTRFQGSNLENCDFTNCNLENADFRGAQLRAAVFDNARLCGTDFTGAILSDVSFHRANLSGAVLPSPTQWLKDNLHRHRSRKYGSGFVAYKTFGHVYKVPSYWKIAPGSVITETVNTDRSVSCAHGINVGTRSAVGRFYKPESDILWQIFIPDQWLAECVVPYNTRGLFRCGRAVILGKAWTK